MEEENKKLKIELTIADINVVLAYLNKGTFSDVSTIIHSIHVQAKDQIGNQVQRNIETE